MKGVLKRFEWQDYTVFGLIVLFSVLLTFQYSSYKQLPSPLYGGDLYFQLAAVNNVKDGGNPFSSPSTLGGLPSYFPIYSVFTGNFAKIFNLNAMTAMFICSIIYVDIGIIILYLLFKNFFPKEIAVISVIFYGYPYVFLGGILKYTEFSNFVVFPMFLLSLTYFFKSHRKILWAVLSGFMYGILSLSHAEGFFIGTMLMPLLFLYLLFFQYYDFKKFDKKKIKKEWKKNLSYFLLIFIIGFAIAQIYWFIPFKEIISGSESPVFRSDAIFTFPYVTQFILSHLFVFKEFPLSVISIFFIAGIVTPLVLRKRSREMKLFYILCIILLLFPFHFLFTRPIVGFDLVPTHMFLHLQHLIIAIISSYGAYMIIHLSQNRKLRTGITIFIYALILFSVLLGYSKFIKDNKWVAVGKTPLPPQLIPAANWIKQNTNVNDVFISTKETGSAINALTGRKFLSVRYNQMPPFSDYFQREADLAVILYGNNSKMRKELIRKYHVKYLYWDFYWFNTDFSFDRDGKLRGYFDPISVPATRHFVDYFKQAGVKFLPVKMTIDPSRRNDPHFKKENLLVAFPANNNPFHPWSNSLDKSLTLEKAFRAGNMTYAKIYRVK